MERRSDLGLALGVVESTAGELTAALLGKEDGGPGGNTLPGGVTGVMHLLESEVSSLPAVLRSTEVVGDCK